MAESGCVGAKRRAVGVWVAIATFGWLPMAAASAQSDPQILYFEPLRISVPQTNGSGRAQKGAHELTKLELSAFGRAYTLNVNTNETFHESLATKPRRSSLSLYRGSIEGLPGSWVRLATQGTDIHGMLWDGTAIYVIAPGDEVQPQLVPPLDASGETVIFRLNDVLMPDAQASCAAADTDEPAHAANAYDSLVRELKSANAKANLGATVRLELSVLADALFRERYLDEESARDSILIRLNNIDGIYSSELGVHIEAPWIDILGANSSTLSSTTNPDTLLKELSRARMNSSALRSRGLTHLFTGRNLDGATVGIAYVDALCSTRFGVGLTEVSSRGAWYESLIAAHEIGHNFGAVHDGEAGKACASTPQGVYLMSPNVNGVTSFSDCSISMMQPRIASASCITALPAANIRVDSDLGTLRRSVDTSFDYEIPVSNAGGATSLSVRADILFPPTLLVEDAYVIGGSCTSGAGVVHCHLGDIAGGTSRSVYFSLRSETIGENTVFAEVFALNETNTSDNTGTGTIAIAREADVSVALEAPAQVAAATPFELRFVVANATSVEARDVRTSIELPPGVSATNVSQPGATCAVENSAVVCLLERLEANATAVGSMQVSAHELGSAIVRAEIIGNYFDPIGSNDSTEVTIEVTPAISPSVVQANRKGGGGSTNLLLLPLLGLLGLWRKSAQAA